MHAEVTHRVEVPVAKQASLTPPVQCFALLVVEKRHDALLVVHVSLLPDERVLHLVDRLLEKLLVLSDQQFLDALKPSFSLRDRVDLDAFDQDLDQRGGLWELGPRQRQVVERDGVGLT